MVRGFYTAASGMVTNEKKLNAYAHNVANVTTAGYKKDNLIQSTFGEHIAVRLNAYNDPVPMPRIGQGVFMTTIDVEYVDHEQGSLDHTQRVFDFAIMGDGYFLVIDGEGNEHLTRDGQFALDEEGFLILPGVGRVQGEDGNIDVGSDEVRTKAENEDIDLEMRADFMVDRTGMIYLEPETDGDEMEEVARLVVVMPDNIDSIKKSSIGTFVPEGYTVVRPNTGTEILQFYTEKSNVNMTQEMTQIIASQRSLQSASQLVKMYDEMTGRSVDTIAKVR